MAGNQDLKIDAPTLANFVADLEAARPQFGATTFTDMQLASPPGGFPQIDALSQAIQAHKQELQMRATALGSSCRFISSTTSNAAKRFMSVDDQNARATVENEFNNAPQLKGPLQIDKAFTDLPGTPAGPTNSTAGPGKDPAPPH